VITQARCHSFRGASSSSIAFFIATLSADILTRTFPSTEITAPLNHSILLRPSSVELGWKSFVIERHTILPGEKSELNFQHHFLILWDGHVAVGEIPAPVTLSVLPVDNQVVPTLRCNPTVPDPCVLKWLGRRTWVRTRARQSVGFLRKSVCSLHTCRPRKTITSVMCELNPCMRTSD
jgi:hypothetical protein